MIGKTKKKFLDRLDALPRTTFPKELLHNNHVGNLAKILWLISARLHGQEYIAPGIPCRVPLPSYFDEWKLLFVRYFAVKFEQIFMEAFSKNQNVDVMKLLVDTASKHNQFAKDCESLKERVLAYKNLPQRTGENQEEHGGLYYKDYTLSFINLNRNSPQVEGIMSDVNYWNDYQFINTNLSEEQIIKATKKVNLDRIEQERIDNIRARNLLNMYDIDASWDYKLEKFSKPKESMTERIIKKLKTKK